MTCLHPFRLLLFFLLPFAGLTVSADEPSVATARQYRIAPQTPQQLRALLHFSDHALPIVSAHRGGAGPGYPENCIATFEHTVSTTFSMLEIDPRMTKDGEIVLHHDATLDRTTTGTGKLSDKTLRELKQLRLKDSEGNVTEYQIPTLDEALQWAKGKTVLVLDQKDVSLEQRVAKITQHHAEAYAMLIVSRFADVQTCYSLNKDIMMEVMIPNHEKIAAFETIGVPWENVIAFVGHVPPQDRSLYDAVHSKGALTMVGTSRNLDQQFAERAQADSNSLQFDYQTLLQRGADIIETDLPRQVGPLLFESNLQSDPGLTSLQID
ncbi:glycerophosphodiester phosphodiesterase family protein [Stieleria sp. TO1_6]|uniref:glycerophosphodiester phosphodiesterase family protein n=1 Tax=Stieleria tagensis TaxID=2956795 RepID=UPI00209AFCCA|nr:glycerophosphodiester phosphodiesterase family protein [Stieleria tagensis]MCO8121546.1 glycerophosphodiester phosphodiesterase family protein [Stieleria tagensis]